MNELAMTLISAGNAAVIISAYALGRKHERRESYRRYLRPPIRQKKEVKAIDRIFSVPPRNSEIPVEPNESEH